MPIRRTYECPGANGHAPHTFKFLHHPTNEPPPRFCPECGCDSQAETFVQSVESPAIARAIGKSVDNHYRAMEQGADARAERARELFGIGDREFADSLKITDLRDNHRVGENSVVPVVNDVTRHMDAVAQVNPSMLGYQADASGYGAQVQVGPHPNAGAHAMQRVRRAHSAYAIKTEGRSITSDTPALETLNPGYRRRA